MASLTEEQRRRIEENKRKALALRAKKQSPVKQSAGPQHLSRGCTGINHAQIEENKRKALALRAQKQSPVKQSVAPQVLSRGGSSINDLQTEQTGSNTSNFGNTKQYSDGNPSQSSNKGSYFSQSMSKAPVGSGNTFSSGMNNSIKQSNSVGLTQSSSFNKATPLSNPSRDFNSNKSSSSGVTSNTFNTSSNSWNKNSGNSNPSAKPTTGNSNLIAKPATNVFSVKFGNNVKGKCVLISRERFEVQVGFSAPLVEVFKSMPTKLYGKVCKQLLSAVQ